MEAPPARVRVVVVRAGPGKGPTALAALAETFREHGWWGDSAERTAWVIVHPGVVPADAGVLAGVLERVGPEAVATIGPLVELADVHAMRTRLEALALGLPPGTVRPWLGDEAMPFVTDDWAREALAPLKGRPELVGAVASYLRHRGNWERAARELGVHRNSVRARIDRAERLLGGTLGDPDLAARTWIALRATGLDTTPEG